MIVYHTSNIVATTKTGSLQVLRIHAI